MQLIIQKEIIENKRKEIHEKLKRYEEMYRNTQSEFYKKSYHRAINRCQATEVTLKWILEQAREVKDEAIV